ncbi:MAG: U6 snRNA-associated Sm-like protein LSm6 [Desulfurococcaceae archaeon]
MSPVVRNIKPVSPFKILKSSEGNVVLVRLKGGYEYIGQLELVDGTMNVVLSNCTEYSNDGKPLLRYGRVVIRGSQVEFISINYGQVSPEFAHV